VRRWLLLSLLVACQRAPTSQPTPAASEAPKVAAPPSTAAKPAPAWYEGSWQGSFQAELFRVELPAGAVKEWKQDDGKRMSGPGTLELAIAADGAVSGSAKGALGELAVTGHAEGDRVALSLDSTAADGFHGFVLAAQTPQGMHGALSASSGDSLTVRKAEVSLTRAAP
jgi:hypothetical protein